MARKSVTKSTATSTTKKKKEVEPEILEVNISGLTDLIDLFSNEDNELKFEPNVDNSTIKPPLTLFDHLNNLTVSKTKWDDLRDCDKKTFNNYMITLWLGMHPDLLEFIDEIQQYATNNLSTKDYYKILYDFLPDTKMYFKFIKSAKEAKYNEELIHLISKHYNVCKKTSIDYLEIYNMNLDGQLALRELIEKYGKTDKEISKMTEIK